MEYHKQLQKNILLYLNEENNTEENYQNVMDIIKSHKIKKDINEFRLILHLIDNISNYHYRAKNFLNKIEKILLSFKKAFTKFFSNDEIIIIFINNKMILFILAKNSMLCINQFFKDYSMDYEKAKYPLYFQDKFQPNSQLSKDFEKNQQNGENENIICKYIRDDDIKSFISYINKEKLSLDKTIDQSIFKTNQFLMDKTPTLIEYSAFFGSIQIFTYLYQNKVKLTSSLWLYSIHGSNSDIIEILEENKIVPSKDNNYENCLEEAIKCHNNEIVLYLKEKYFQNNSINEYIEMKSANYYNFAFFPENLYKNRKQFYCYCKFDYYNFVREYLKNKDIDINFEMDDTFNKFSYIYTPLLISARKNNFNIVKLLLKQPNVNVNFNVLRCDFSKNEETLNVLIYAIMNNNIEMAKLFLENNKFDVNATLIMKEYIDGNKLKIEEYCVLYEAIICKKYEITKLLLAHQKIDVNIRQKISIFKKDDEYQSLNKITLLHKAIDINSVKAVKKLINHPNIDVNKYSSFDDDEKKVKLTPLAAAIERKNYKIVKILLEHQNIDVNKISSFKSKDSTEKLTPLNLAIKNKDHLMVKILLEHQNIDVNKISLFKDNVKIEELTSLISAIEDKDNEMIKLLLDHPKIDVNLSLVIKSDKKEKSISPLLLAFKKDRIDLALLLLSHKKIDVNRISTKKTKDTEIQQTPLIYAIKKHDQNFVNILLKNPKFDVNLHVNNFKNGERIKENPLTIATQLSKQSIVSCLLNDDNINVNAKYIIEDQNKTYIEKNSLILAIEKNDIDIQKLLLKQFEIDVNIHLFFKNKTISEQKRTALFHLIIKQKNAEIVKMVLNKPRIDINIISFVKKGQITCYEEVETPTICYAVLRSNCEILQLLLKNQDLNLNAKLKRATFKSNHFYVYEKSALQLTIINHYYDLFELLFDYLRKNGKLIDNLKELIILTNNEKINSLLYDEINKQS